MEEFQLRSISLYTLVSDGHDDARDTSEKGDSSAIIAIATRHNANEDPLTYILSSILPPFSRIAVL